MSAVGNFGSLEYLRKFVYVKLKSIKLAETARDRDLLSKVISGFHELTAVYL